MYINRHTFWAQSASDYARGSPPPSWAGARKGSFATFRGSVQEGGGFHGRSQSPTEPKKVCRFPRSFPKNPRNKIPQKQLLFS